MVGIGYNLLDLVTISVKIIVIYGVAVEIIIIINERRNRRKAGRIDSRCGKSRNLVV